MELRPFGDQRISRDGLLTFVRVIYIPHATDGADQARATGLTRPDPRMQWLLGSGTPGVWMAVDALAAEWSSQVAGLAGGQRSGR
jgi:hypothetical protein